MATIEAERRGRSGSIQKPPRSLQAEMECDVSGSSLDETENITTEVARACKRLRELSTHLRRGEDDSGLQSDCDESMPVIVNCTDSEVSKHFLKSNQFSIHLSHIQPPPFFLNFLYANLQPSFDDTQWIVFHPLLIYFFFVSSRVETFEAIFFF